MKLKDLRDKLVKEAAKKEVKETVVKIKDEVDTNKDKIVSCVFLLGCAYLCYKAGYANGTKKALETIKDNRVYNIIVNKV